MKAGAFLFINSADCKGVEADIIVLLLSVLDLLKKLFSTKTKTKNRDAEMFFSNYFSNEIKGRMQFPSQGA